MSTIDAVTTTSNYTAAAASDTSSGLEAAMGKEDFLMLLVAQLQNQDPLNPDEPTEFTAQLAQFSSLEQLFTLNDSMEALVESNNNANQMSSLGTIGKEVVYYSGSFEYTGEPVEIGYQLDGIASEVTLELQRNGTTVATLTGEELAAGNHYLTWDGTTTSGAVAESGTYTIALTAKAASGETVAAAPIVKSEVTGVDLDGASGGTLITKMGEIAFNDILGIYEIGADADSSEEDDETSEEAETDIVDETEETVETVADITDDISEIVE